MGMTIRKRAEYACRVAKVLEECNSRDYCSEDFFSRKEIELMSKSLDIPASWLIKYKLDCYHDGEYYINERWSKEEGFVKPAKTETFSIPIKALYWNGKKLSDWDNRYGIKSYERDKNKGLSSVKLFIYSKDPFRARTKSVHVPLDEIEVVDETFEVTKYYYNINFEMLEKVIDVFYGEEQTLKSDIEETRKEFEKIQKRLRNLQEVIDYKTYTRYLG